MMKGVKLICAALVLCGLLVGCGDQSASAPTAPSAPAAEAAPTPPPAPQVDPKADYVNQLNQIGVKSRLMVISQYGTAIQSFDETNQNEVQSLKDADAAGIPKFQDLLNYLNKMSVPDDYKPFHTNLTKGVSEFITTMQELDQHVDTDGDTQHMINATAHYMSSTDAIMQAAKQLPFGQLQ